LVLLNKESLLRSGELIKFLVEIPARTILVFMSGCLGLILFEVKSESLYFESGSDALRSSTIGWFLTLSVTERF